MGRQHYDCALNHIEVGSQCVKEWRLGVMVLASIDIQYVVVFCCS